MRNVLVFPCGTEIALEIHKAVKDSMHFKLFGANSIYDNHGRFVFKNYIGNLPSVKDTCFIEKLNKLIDKYKIDIVFPAHDEVLTFMAEHSLSINAIVIANSYETCYICRSKSRTYKLLKEIIKTPKIYDNINDIDNYPVFLKPDVGQGSKDTLIVYDKRILEIESDKKEKRIICEYLPGKEYTIDCISDRNGNLIFCEGRIRNRITNGITTNTKKVINEEFENFARRINDKLNFIGAWFFQLKEDYNGELTLLEVGPRIAGTMAYYRNLGVNFPLITLYQFLGIDTEIIKLEHELELDRAFHNTFINNLHYRNVYVDLDDTIIINGKLNILLISFLYQCINNGKNIVLLTRRTRDLNNYLEKYKIKQIFNKIIQVKEDDEKYNYINDTESIFIDDSFSERSKVHKKVGIQVFDLSSIESLIDWRE